MSSPKSVVHIFHDDPDSLATGSRVAVRLVEVAADHGVAVEVFCFGAAQKHLTAPTGEASSTFNANIDSLLASGVRVGACINVARSEGTEEALRARGITLSVARDEFLRFTLESATVISF